MIKYNFINRGTRIQSQTAFHMHHATVTTVPVTQTIQKNLQLQTRNWDH